MSWQILFPAFLLGLISSFHCIGMCGPIAFSLPVQLLPSHKKFLGILLYNAGRVTTYTVLGILFGLVGREFFLGGWQQGFSIALGISILIVLTINLINRKTVSVGFLQSFQSKLQQFIAKFIRRQQLSGVYMIGVANGFLPCGMVYLAIAGALGTGSIKGGIFFMMLFGVGTIPLMLAVTWFGLVVNITIRNTVRKITPFFIALIGILLTLRGLNLNIPYLSPLLESSSGKIVPCH